MPHHQELVDHRTISISQEEFEDTKGVIGIRISKNRQYNVQKKKG
jgi:hypothetical protein